jgi:alanine racemase
MPRPIRALFDSAALRNNLAIARARAPSARVWAVVKANAYGHGLSRAVEALAPADGFALLDLDEAVRLRDAGVRKPILLLEGFFSLDDLATVVEHSLSVVIHSEEQVDMLVSAGFPARIPLYLKLDTGMNRLGFSPAAFAIALERLQGCRMAGEITLMTHFADADGERGIRDQFERFASATDGLALPRSLANSAALLRYPESHAEWVRPGIMLYGCSPFAEQAGFELGLAPAMTLESRIIAVQQLRRGDIVGYGGLFVADRDTRMGVVTCGYADGYPRHAPTGTPIMVEGRMTRTLGRVSMDMLCADLNDIPEARVGSRVVLWGEGAPVERVAEAAGTVGYELLCGLAPRVPIRVRE